MRFRAAFIPAKGRASLILALAAAIAVASLVALLAGSMPAEAKKKAAKIYFASDRTTDEGVDNPEGDLEIFVMKPDGTGLKQLTFNTVDDVQPTLSPDGTKIAYTSFGTQTSNPEGYFEVYLMDALDGSGQQNLTKTCSGIDDSDPDYAPDGTKITYESSGAQTSNPEGDLEVYLMNGLDGSGQQNLTYNSDIGDAFPDYAPDDKKIAYESFGVQTSNPEGDEEIYTMNALDGSNPKNLTKTDNTVHDFHPAWASKQ